MKLTIFDSPVEFRDRALPFLQRKEAQNCLGLGIVDTLINRPEIYPKAYLWTVTDGGDVVGAAWMTPPHPIGLTEMPDQALELIVTAATAIADRPQSVVGPKQQADRFRDSWTERTGALVESTMEQRIYQAPRSRCRLRLKGKCG